MNKVFKKIKTEIKKEVVFSKKDKEIFEKCSKIMENLSKEDSEIMTKALYKTFALGVEYGEEKEEIPPGSYRSCGY